MAIAPITGMLKKRIIFDVTTALTLGVIAGGAWLYGFHVPKVEKREAWYREHLDKKGAGDE